MARAHWPLVASAVATVATVGLMAALPGRTSTHSRVTVEEVAAVPHADGFHLDGMRFDLGAYRRDTRLEPLRQFMTITCPGRAGLGAAVCISDEFVRRFPFGAPHQEFVNPAYDPVADLRAHLAGEPGHCVTRSGLVAAILLASGISARQVQITGVLGHNVLEVYDEVAGWVMFDPTFGVTYASPDRPERPISVAAAVETKGILVTKSIGLSASSTPELREIPEALFPDPWLYTRSGERAARWPFRGLFVHVGRTSLRFSLGQELARGGFLAFGLLTLFLGIRRIRGRARSQATATAADSGRERDSLLTPAPSREA